jgi:predicted  nucleic acid-binding Zn-ribbon protein
MGKLRDKVPAPVLVHYERLVLRGRKGVAIARRGVCSECHLHITGGKLVSLGHANEVQRCDNCGRYLYLPEDELVGVSNPPPAPAIPAKRGYRKAADPVS